jgi:hypothetical protein
MSTESLYSRCRPRFYLTICLNGVPWKTDDFSAETTVDQVVSAAVEHFLAEGLAGLGGFALALIVYGYLNPPLRGNRTLGEGHVTSGSLLKLILRNASDQA